LEDSVPYHEKPSARELIKVALSQRDSFKNALSLYVRTDSYESGNLFTDLEAIIREGITGVVIPKVNDSIEICEISSFISRLEVERKISNNIQILPSIETAKGVVNAYSIAKSDSRVNLLVFGVFDFLNDMQIEYREYGGDEYSYARAKIPVDARAAGVSAIDAIWQKVEDTDGLVNDTVLAKRLGYVGKCIIHPNQIEPVQKVFAPNKFEIEWAKKVIESLEPAMEMKSKIGAVRIDGKMIDAVHYKYAKTILKSVEAQSQP
jgi:citrate lyase subunit beta/citryl-CoA lyase